jgi:hypothetical protein
MDKGSVAVGFSVQVEELYATLKQSAELVASQQAKSIWAGIDDREKKAEIPNGLYTARIEKTAGFLRFLESQKQFLSISEDITRFTDLYERYANIYAELQIAQRKAYNRWAIDIIKNTFDYYIKSEESFGMLEKSKRLSQISEECLADRLAVIDMKFLEAPAYASYSDVYSLFYNNLKDVDRKILII